MLIDVTLILKENIPVYPGDPKFEIEKIYSIESSGFNLHRLTMGTHTGTHMDAPLHFLSGGNDISQLDINNLRLTALVADTSGLKKIDSAYLRTLDLNGLGALLFKTNSKAVYLTADGARFLTARGIRLVGTENPDIEDSPDNCFEVHHILLGNSIPVVENLFLKNVSEGKYIFYCFPLNVYGADACPVRAILEPLDNSL